MAARKTIKDIIDGSTAKKKTSGFLDGLKNWITSPGGVVTVILIISVVLYVNHKTEKA